MPCKMISRCDSSEARAKIQETGTDKMVKRGSSIELNCTVESGDQVEKNEKKYRRKILTIQSLGKKNNCLYILTRNVCSEN